MKKRNGIFFSWDAVTIYDGPSSTSSMMGKFCGDSIPHSHVSSSNKVLIHFLSDFSNTIAGTVTVYGGFQMEYNPTGKQNTSMS